ncbi:mannose-1-phosphate guanylyltransferase [Oceanihabitans sediminis]|uniref:mannose-1-phosphate guanylyltransferase n=1 Tax=Oceanihabitans sediminis TaxID=1812012 RepID=UPI003A8F1889
MKPSQIVNHVVLTGGVGSRLWPLSRKSHPKQYLDLFNGKSLFEMTIERNRDLINKTTVVGNVDNYSLSKEILNKTSTCYTNIVEATPRNTAAAIAFAAFASDPEDILLVTPSDHIISNDIAYIQAVNEAVSKAYQGNIVTFGIKPTKPETGYGYIEFEGDNVNAFHEKPSMTKAIEFIKQNNFYWNSGMFCFKSCVFLEELKKFEPAVYENSKKAWCSNRDGYLNLEFSLNIPSISVDYAIMERSDKIKVVPSLFEWSDLGSFESVYDYLIKTGHTVDESGNLVIGTDVHTSFIGLENCIFVHTNDAFLILKKDKSQDVKKIYQHLEFIKSNLV